MSRRLPVTDGASVGDVAQRLHAAVDGRLCCRVRRAASTGGGTIPKSMKTTLNGRRPRMEDDLKI